MIMKNIRLQNFQAHKDTTIELADTITALTGGSHHGKSSVVRAFLWNRDNKPKNPRFIHKGTKKAIVTQGIVRHERTEKTNKYFVEGHKDPFTALRGAVPEEVQQALGIGEDNIQSQHDKIFLLDDSGGKVAQKLSALVDLESTTTALKYIASKKRTHNSNVETLRRTIENTEIELARLEHVKQANTELLILEAEDVSITQLKVKYTKLGRVIENAVQAKLELSRIPSTEALEPAKQLVAHYKELQSTIEKYDTLEKAVSEIVSLEHIVSFNPKKLLKKARRLEKVKSKRNSIATSLYRAEEFEETASTLFVKENDLKYEKEDLLKDGCPMCGRT